MCEAPPPCAHSLFEAHFEIPTGSSHWDSQWEFRNSQWELAKLPLGACETPSGSLRNSHWELPKLPVGSQWEPSGSGSASQWARPRLPLGGRGGPEDGASGAGDAPPGRCVASGRRRPSDSCDSCHSCHSCHIVGQSHRGVRGQQACIEHEVKPHGGRTLTRTQPPRSAATQVILQQLFYASGLGWTRSGGATATTLWT